MMNKREGWIQGILVALGVMTLASAMIALFTSLGYLSSFRIVFGSVYVLFLPGFVLSFVFFLKTREFDKKEKGSIDWIERIALSFALSIAIVPLTVFYLNLVGVRINLMNSFFTILGILIVSGVLVGLRFRFRKN
jgi:uncharacterized membrane protein